MFLLNQHFLVEKKKFPVKKKILAKLKFLIEQNFLMEKKMWKKCPVKKMFLMKQTFLVEKWNLLQKNISSSIRKYILRVLMTIYQFVITTCFAALRVTRQVISCDFCEASSDK